MALFSMRKLVRAPVDDMSAPGGRETQIPAGCWDDGVQTLEYLFIAPSPTRREG
jgi:hypothetical protein